MKYFADLTTRREPHSPSSIPPLFLTINETAEEIKSITPKTAITPYFIRSLCKDNKIKFLSAGKKILIDFDYFVSYLKKGALR